VKFRVPPAIYRVKVCAGELRLDGKRVAALTHRREIHISGDIHPAERSEALYDQLRRLFEQHHGPMSASGIAAFTTDFSRQLQSQGGEAALMRLSVEGIVVAGDVEDVAAEPTGCECGQCGTRYAPQQIRTGAPFTFNTGQLARPREVDCDFCGKVMAWVEGCTQAGAPTGRVLSGPNYHTTSPLIA
jgi:hypothetical protein